MTFHVDPDPELDNFLVYYLSIYDDLMSHHVPSPPGYDVVMTEQVSGPKEPKLLGRHMPSVPNGGGPRPLKEVLLKNILEDQCLEAPGQPPGTSMNLRNMLPKVKTKVRPGHFS